MSAIKTPVKALRSWEPYVTPDADEMAEHMAKPFTRIEDADGWAIVSAHDCFAFQAGHAERIVLCLNACAGLDDDTLRRHVALGVALAEYSQIKNQRDEMAKTLTHIARQALAKVQL